jgi:hypothetical protein
LAAPKLAGSGIFLDWLLRFFGEGLSTEERRRFGVVLWRLMVSGALLWGFGMGPVQGFATEATVDKKLAAALQPVLEELRLLRQGLERNNEQQRQLLIEAVVTRIRDMQKVCMALPVDSAPRQRMASMIEAAQIEYQTLTSSGRYKGARYPLAQQCE